MSFQCLLFLIILHSSLSVPLTFIDLSHTIHPSIPFFPSQVRFNFTQRIAQWMNEDNKFFYATNAFTTGEHMGTHIDAPYHFSPTGWKVDEIPFSHLISVHARIIDVSKRCSQDKNYLITIDDVKRSDLSVPEIDAETGERFLFVLIFYTGWTKYWPDQTAYAGNNSDVQFPGLSEQLAIYLVNTYGDNFVGVGIDTLSTDYGQSKTYAVHQILARHNKYGLENLALTENLLNNVQKNFFTLDVHPMKIGNGTGAPCRVVVRLNGSKQNTNWFGLLIFFILTFLLGFVIKIVYDFKCTQNKEY
ncbi:unnamed protein product [Adineta ricciae]|uniref:Kynurenine formamidase n=1 Tax=Adineta ricciae TaxID=249248 RepID=A0A814SX05_ADIRI|nr:unnamed protein product [Adineta ricciae]CAF1320730.1 unnamed protein product [Adineta ricciae]